MTTVPTRRKMNNLNVNGISMDKLSGFNESDYSEYREINVVLILLI